MAAHSNSAGRDTDRKSDLAVMDANEYKQKRRLERILDAMDNIPDQADRAKEQYFEGEINHHGRCVLVHDAVKDAIWEAWNLLVDHENKCQQRAEQAEDDDEKDEDGPWPHSRYFTGHPNEVPLGIIEQPRGENIVIWGLRDFFETDEMWVNRWEEKEKPRNGAVDTITREQTYTVPRDVSWRTALRLKEFLNEEHDMEITFEAMEKDVHAEPF